MNKPSLYNEYEVENAQGSLLSDRVYDFVTQILKEHAEYSTIELQHLINSSVNTA